MFYLIHLFWPWGLIVVGLAVVHFIRRRPDTFWLYVIIFAGPIGAAIYIVAEVIPDAGLMRQGFRMFPRRKRIGQLQALVRTNPSPGNYEELGDLLMDDGKFARAREAFTCAITPRTDTPDPFYRRGACALELGDPAAAIPDLERVVAAEPGYDFHRAAALLAHAFALTGRKVEAEALFRRVTAASVASETYLNFADLLAGEGRPAEAREWAQKVLDKKPGMPGYLRRRERKWFWRAKALLRRVPGT